MRAFRNGSPSPVFSAFAGPLAVTTPPLPVPPLQPPSNLRALRVEARRVTVAWLDRSRDETGFQLERAGGGPNPVSFNLAPNVTSFIDATVQPGTPYSYRVRARKGQLFFAFSNTLPVTTPAATGVQGVRRAAVRLYRGTQLVASGTLLAGPNGQFTGSIRGFSAGSYRAEADGFDASGRLIARAQGTAEVRSRQTVVLRLIWTAVGG